MGLYKIPIKFGRIDGDFDICSNSIDSLEDGPYEVSGSYYTVNNKLKTLKGPKLVGHNFNCTFNEIDTLEGAPSNEEVL